MSRLARALRVLCRALCVLCRALIARALRVLCRALRALCPNPGPAVDTGPVVDPAWGWNRARQGSRPGRNPGLVGPGLGSGPEPSGDLAPAVNLSPGGGPAPAQAFRSEHIQPCGTELFHVLLPIWPDKLSKTTFLNERGLKCKWPDKLERIQPCVFCII